MSQKKLKWKVILMANKYGLRLTRVGLNKIMEAQIEGERVKLRWFAVGDGETEVDSEQTELHDERWRGEINRVYLDPTEESRIRVECVIPADVGGWYIREVGLIDEDGDLIAIQNYPESWKPSIDSGTTKEVAITAIIQLSDTELIELVIDPNTTLVTQRVLEAELNLFREEVSARLKEQDDVITVQQDQIDLLSKAIERIMIEMELEQKLQEGYAFFTALDGLAQGMTVNNKVSYLPSDYSDGIKVQNSIDATEGEVLRVFNEGDSEDFVASLDGDDIVVSGLSGEFRKGSAVARSTVLLKEDTKEIIPLPYKLSDITSEVV